MTNAVRKNNSKETEIYKSTKKKFLTGLPVRNTGVSRGAYAKHGDRSVTSIVTDGKGTWVYIIRQLLPITQTSTGEVREVTVTAPINKAQSLATSLMDVFLASPSTSPARPWFLKKAEKIGWPLPYRSLGNGVLRTVLSKGWLSLLWSSYLRLKIHISSLQLVEEGVEELPCPSHTPCPTHGPSIRGL